VIPNDGLRRRLLKNRRLARRDVETLPVDLRDGRRGDRQLRAVLRSRRRAGRDGHARWIGQRAFNAKTQRREDAKQISNDEWRTANIRHSQFVIRKILCSVRVHPSLKFRLLPLDFSFVPGGGTLQISDNLEFMSV
jgi:hypothetical protein